MLLREIINTINIKEKSIILHDVRFKYKVSKKKLVKFKKIPSNIFSRFLAEYWIFKNVNKDDVVLYFGNLPPLFRLKGKVFVFIQNRFLLDKKYSYKLLSFFVKTRINYERFILNLFKNNVDKYIVQTESMLKLLKEIVDIEIYKLPFVPQTELKIKKILLKIKEKFTISFMLPLEKVRIIAKF